MYAYPAAVSSMRSCQYTLLLVELKPQGPPSPSRMPCVTGCRLCTCLPLQGWLSSSCNVLGLFQLP